MPEIKSKNLKKVEKREAAILAREREIHHNEVLAQAAIDAKKEKVAPKDCYMSFQHVDKIYPNHVQAVFDFNLDIKEKEFIVFVGPSGCGKSTTLRMVAGLEDITAGDLYIGGVYANNLPPKDRKIGMVFQSYALFPHMTVYENMAFALEVEKMDKKEIQDRVLKAAEILQITEYLDRKPNALSGGQCQRVALGRAIVANSKIFLMDEPLSNLDAKLRVAMRSEIVKLHRSLNTTTIYVTHDQTEAMTMADRIVVMNKGYVQQIGTPSEIFNEPANIFVATFIGSPSMNLLRGKQVGSKFTIDDYALDLGKDFDAKVVSFYEKQIEATKAELAMWKEKFLTRTIEGKRYQSLLKGEKINHRKVNLYLSCLEEEALASIGTSVKEQKEKFQVIENKDELDKALKELLKEYLFAYHTLRNPAIRELFANVSLMEDAKSSKERKVILGIRPEHFNLVTSKSDESLELSVSVVELLGSEYFLHLPYLDDEIVVKSPVKETIKTDDKVIIDFDKSKVHIFDPITKKKII